MENGLKFLAVMLKGGINSDHVNFSDEISETADMRPAHHQLITEPSWFLRNDFVVKT